MTGRGGIIRERRRKRQRRSRFMLRQKSLRRLPKEILEEIFHRLPLNSMSGCRLTCKEWNSIISDPEFVVRDYHRRPTSPTHIIASARQLGCYGLEVHALKFNGEPSLRSRLRDVRGLFGCSRPKIVGSCNGLVAVAFNNKYVLWNPLTRNYTSFPGPSYNTSDCALYGLCYHHSTDEDCALYGLCYDHSTDEYSIVKTAYKSRTTSTLTNLSMSTQKMIDSSAFWPEPDLMSNTRRFEGEIGKVICGFPHWLLSFYETDENPMLLREIIYFDSKDEMYKQMERPREAIGEDKTIVGLADLGGERELGMVLHDGRSLSLDVWVMKEYGNVKSWTKLFVISTLLFHGITKFYDMEVLGYLPNGKILIDVNSWEFWAYDHANRNARQIQIQIKLGDRYVCRRDFLALTCYYPSIRVPRGLV